MRLVRIDDDEPRTGVYEREKALAVKRGREVLFVRGQLYIEKLEREERQAQAKAARALKLEEAKREKEANKRLAAEIAKGSDRLMAVASRKSHEVRGAPTLKELALRPFWTVEELAYVNFYLGTSSTVRNSPRSMLFRHQPITLYGHKFEWDGERYVQNAEAE